MTIFGDLFRDHELSGWGKALWALFLILVPWLGALVYLIVRGRSINERALAQRHEQDLRRYVRRGSATAGRRCPPRPRGERGGRVDDGSPAGSVAAGPMSRSLPTPYTGRWWGRR
jgi:hypothetical protein